MSWQLWVLHKLQKFTNRIPTFLCIFSSVESISRYASSCDIVTESLYPLRVIKSSNERIRSNARLDTSFALIPLLHTFNMILCICRKISVSSIIFEFLFVMRTRYRSSMGKYTYLTDSASTWVH